MGCSYLKQGVCVYSGFNKYAFRFWHIWWWFHAQSSVTDHNDSSNLGDKKLRRLARPSTVPPLGNSDHSGIQVELYANQLPASKVNRKKKVLWCLDRGDYAKMKHIIDSSN